MTGRKARLVRQQGGLTGVKWEARNASGVAASATLDLINVHERQMFLNLEKRIAIISEAASAGISLHADRRAKNQQRRVHLTLELPWSADKAIQQFGRSHRANQAHPPQYRLLFTPLGGERRFAAAVARRLESLGALTQGDRRAGPSLTAFNYESRWGQVALKATYKAIMEEEGLPVMPPCCRPNTNGQAHMTLQQFLGQARAHLLNVGIIRPRDDVSAIDINAFLSRPEGAPPSVGKIADPDKIDVARFLNRLLGLAPEAQGQIFDLYQAVLEASIQRARKEGKYDEGIVDLKGTAVTLAQPPQIIRRDESTGAPTLLFRVHVDRGISWDMAQNLLNAALAPSPSHAAPAAPALQESARAGRQQPGQVPLAPSSGPGGSGHVPAALSQSLGDPTKPKQKLRIRFSGELVKAEDVSKPGSNSQDHKPASPPVPSVITKSDLPAAAPTSRVTDKGAASASFSPSAGADADALETHVSSVQELLQLHDMESQTRLDSLGATAAAAAAEPIHIHEGWDGDAFVQQEQPSRSKGPHTSSATEHVAAPTAVGTSNQCRAPSPALGTPQQMPEHVSTTTRGVNVDLHGGLGDGRATGSVVGATEPGPASCVSGYYQPRRGAVRGLLLALEAQGKGQFAVYRPATGPAARPMRIDDLTEKYVRVHPLEAKAQWQHQYAASGNTPERGVGARGGWRVRELVLIGGLVLPIWGMVERALVKQHRPADRRMHVLRLHTTGENAKRLVGMLLPKGAVEDLLEELRNQQFALQAQQAQHAQQPHADNQAASPELVSQAFRGTDHVQQLSELQARLQDGFASSPLPQPASRRTYM
ncbi:MAG: strawberry notch-1 [Trebouxia sp. A1-2]|nr:MAG: strawberry notch-1 [Trebouxia sp. A1-2]